MTETQHFDLRAARYLRTVLRTGGFSAAAAVHHRTQQAISKAIARFEDTLGLALLQRNLGQLAPTPEGELVLARLERIELELEALAQDIDVLHGDRRPRLRVGLGLSADAGPLGRALLEEVAAGPDVALSVETGTSLDMVPDLAQGMLDMVIALDLGGAVPAHSRIERRVLGSHRFRLVVADEGVTAAPSLAELGARPWVVGRHLDGLQREVWARLQEQGVSAPRSVSSSSLSFVLEAVLRHGYVSILPESLGDAAVGRQGLRFLDAPGCCWELPLCLYLNRQAMKRSWVSRAVAALESACA